MVDCSWDRTVHQHFYITHSSATGANDCLWRQDERGGGEGNCEMVAIVNVDTKYLNVVCTFTLLAQAIAVADDTGRFLQIYQG